MRREGQHSSIVMVLCPSCLAHVLSEETQGPVTCRMLARCYCSCPHKNRLQSYQEQTNIMFTNILPS